MARYSEIQRQTRETDVRVRLELDGGGLSDITTGIGFLDHMLMLFARHGQFDLMVRAEGDRHVDDHHTTEDVGIVLGQALRQTLGDKRGVSRFGHAYVAMDDALARTVIDLSGRPYCVYAVSIGTAKVGSFDTELVEHFCQSFAFNGMVTVHIDLIRGRNTHHIVEAVFKSLGLALYHATRVTRGDVPSTKEAL